MRIKILEILFGGLRKRKHPRIDRESLLVRHLPQVHIHTIALLMPDNLARLRGLMRRRSLGSCTRLQKVMLEDLGFLVELRLNGGDVGFGAGRDYSKFVEVRVGVHVVCELGGWFYFESVLLTVHIY